MTTKNAKTRWVDFSSVKEAVSIEQILIHYGIRDQFKPHGAGQNIRGCCPIHQGDKSDQFSVDLGKNVWICRSSACSCGGNILDFVAKMERISIYKAAILISQWFNLSESDAFSQEKEVKNPQSKSGNKPASSEPVSPLAEPVEEAKPNKPLGFALSKLDPTHPYLAERGLTRETVDHFGLGFCDKGMMAGRIVVPIHNASGHLVAYAGRWPGDPADADTPKWKLPPGYLKTLDVFNLHRAVQESAETPLVIVEGFIGCIWLYQCGHPKSVAIMGSAMSATQQRILMNHLTPESKVIVMLDEDPAGRIGRAEIAARLASCCYVHVHSFADEGMQPESMSAFM